VQRARGMGVRQTDGEEEREHGTRRLLSPRILARYSGRASPTLTPTTLPPTPSFRTVPNVTSCDFILALYFRGEVYQRRSRVA